MGQCLAFSARSTRSLGHPSLPNALPVAGEDPAASAPVAFTSPCAGDTAHPQLLPHMLPIFVSAPVPTSHSAISPNCYDPHHGKTHNCFSKVIIAFYNQVSHFSTQVHLMDESHSSKNETDRPFQSELNPPCFKRRPIRFCS